MDFARKGVIGQDRLQQLPQHEDGYLDGAVQRATQEADFARRWAAAARPEAQKH